jgi:BioD-like phosphotransacetylase family protein
MAPTLLIGSCESFSGKSAVVLGLARQLSRLGVPVRFGKPLATSLDAPGAQSSSSALLDADVRFIGATLGLPESHLIPSLHVLDAAKPSSGCCRGIWSLGQAFPCCGSSWRQPPMA